MFARAKVAVVRPVRINSFLQLIFMLMRYQVLPSNPRFRSCSSIGKHFICKFVGSSFFHDHDRTHIRWIVQSEPIYVSLSNLLPSEGPSSSEDKVALLDPSVFDHPMRRDILHLCVNYVRDNLRQGTASTKTRGEVRGSGRKIRPQKGTGRARLGDGQSPMLRGGGVAFGPKPRDFSTDLPRKVRQMGMKVVLSAKLREEALGVSESLDWQGIKTKGFAQRLNQLGWSGTLFVTGSQLPRLERVSRNIPDVGTILAQDLNVYEALKWRKLVLDVAAVDYFEKALSKNVPVEERIPPRPEPKLRFSRMMAGQRRKRSPKIPGVDVPLTVAAKAGQPLYEEEIVAS